MAENSKIQWTDSTFNPWIGCTEVSSACDFCYARTMMQDRYKRVEWGNHPRERTAVSNWEKPRYWNRNAEKSGIRRKVFCASLADVFDNQVPSDWRVDLWALIASTPALDWLLLTKRPQNIRKMLPNFKEWPFQNCWLGTTVENQEEANRRIPDLLEVPATVHFLSCEPLLGSVDLTAIARGGLNGVYIDNALNGFRSAGVGGYFGNKIGWVIGGGESGQHARLSSPKWFRSLRDQCVESGVPYFHKQNGEWLEESQFGWLSPSMDLERCICASGLDGEHYRRVGVNAAGDMLDGTIYREFPRPTT